MSPQPQARDAERLPEMDGWQSARERVLSIEGKLAALEGQLNGMSAEEVEQYDPTQMKRQVEQLRYDFDRHTHKASAISGVGEVYQGMFKIYKYSATSVYVNSGYVVLNDSTEYVTGGELAIGTGAGYHVIVLNIWYNGGWKWSITDDSTWPDARSTIVDGGNFECFKKVIGVCTVADSEVVDESVLQIIHDEALNLVDWSRSGVLFRVVKVAPLGVSIASGVVISGTDVNQVSSTTSTIPSGTGSYYVYADIYYDLATWECDLLYNTSYPTQTVDNFRKLLAIVVVSGGVITQIFNVHRGDEIINPRVAE